MDYGPIPFRVPSPSACLTR